MTTAAVKEFVNFFREFLDLCLSHDWPAKDAAPEEITKALEVAHHVELSVQKMKFERNCFDMFLDLLCIDQNFTNTFLQNCMSDPPKFILKKIINSDADVKFIDIAFERFRLLYSEERLVGALSDLMVEAASKETLLKNMPNVLPALKVQEFYNHLHLFSILNCESNEILVNALKNCHPEMINTSVLCLVRDNLVGLKRNDLELIKRKIIVGFTSIMNCRDSSVHKFWQLLFNVDKENLIAMCLKYKTLAEMIFDAIGDRYEQIRDGLPDERCYIQINESQLKSVCDTILETETLKVKFFNYMKNNGYESITYFCKLK